MKKFGYAFVMLLTLIALPGYAATVNEAGSLYKQRNFKAAYSMYLALAKSGSPQAQYWVGYMNEHSRGIAGEADQAISWYLESANQGYVEAQFALGNIFYAGRAKQEYREQAGRWFGLAAKQGHKKAARLLASLTRSEKNRSRKTEVKDIAIESLQEGLHVRLFKWGIVAALVWYGGAWVFKKLIPIVGTFAVATLSATGAFVMVIVVLTLDLIDLLVRGITFGFVKIRMRYRRCPHCYSVIRSEATVCKNCGIGA